ncbi:trypsin-like serine protease [Seongchinamella unica]|uniref:Trypsin-like serine protease n=1 Tax=Seongchinamella unica TaxID=2547392 RepID=A0A4V2ZWX2_9GAMM|nr:trypsin-like peptidase domain-containing protein [Seongchinamella unica]TDG12058.1 trypsin-like serine protease [Seongchinamella unica]
MLIQSMNFTLAIPPILLFWLLPGASGSVADEQRLVYTEHSPRWLQSVGKLDVPGIQFEQGRRRHQRESCSGTLVAPAGKRLADIVVTAWHCLEFYRDLSQSITFTLLPGSDRAIRREAHRLADGGGMDADWALLRLSRPVDTGAIPAMELNPAPGDLRRPVTMAGFSGDNGLGQDGALLTYHDNCRITRQNRQGSETDCSAYKGASGGAVIQLTDQGRAQLTGVISRGDSEGTSIYVPVAYFRRPLDQYLN